MTRGKRPTTQQLGLFGSPSAAEAAAEPTRGHADRPPPSPGMTADPVRPADSAGTLEPPTTSGQAVGLFGAVEPAPRGRTRPQTVLPAPPVAAHLALSQALRPNLYLGTSSWGFGGWAGFVWDRAYPDERLSREGLGAYASHPLLRTVGVDRTHYRPMGAAELAGLAARVPPAFRFLVKAHEDCTLSRFPNHPRYGARREHPNPLFLDAAYAADIVVAPFVEGLGTRAGVLLFQFAPQPIGQLGGVGRFADALHAFLSALPRGPRYAVELRNTQLLAPSVADALHDVGAVPALSAWSGLPPVEEQARRLRAHEAPLRVIRWMLQEGGSYEDARDRFAPFDVLAEPDPVTRAAIARLVNATAEDTYVIVNNKAEGSAPRSVFALAEAIARGA